MDQSRFWIHKQQTCFNSHVVSSFGDSWEEQAFAEDATGPLGGCIWPPRSYTCSFCRREFRSAQALGGHMNVHRRDRARLKKIASSNDNQVLEPHTSFDICVLQYPNKIPTNIPSKNLSDTIGSENGDMTSYLAPRVTLGSENPNKICNPNLELDHPLHSSSSKKPSRVSLLHPFTCSFSQEHHKRTPILTCSKFESQKGFHLADFGNQDKGSTQVLDSNLTPSQKSDQQIDVHLASELVYPQVRRRCDSETPMISDKDDMRDGMVFKKRRIEGGPRSFFPKESNLLDGDEVESLVPLECSTNSTLENLDLELRLGDRP